MAVTITPLGLSGSLRIITDSDCDATVEKNVNDGAAVIYSIDVDNTLNAAVSYIKFYDTANPTVGTTDPDMVLMLPASVRRQFVFKTGNNFSTSLSYAGVTAGGTGGTTNPTSDVAVAIVVS